MEGGARVSIFAADREAGLFRLDGGRMGPGGQAVCAGFGRVYCAGPGECRCYSAGTGEMLGVFPVPTGVCAMACLGGMVYALSSDSDSVSAFHPETGQLLIAAPAGMYPRALCKSPCGRYLAVAGGAAGEILIFDGQLRPVGRRRVPGTACGVCFLPRGLCALCAVGDGEISSRLYCISPRGNVEERFAHPAPPCALCALPGGGCLVGCHGEIVCLRPDGKISFRLPCAYPAKFLQTGRETLLCDAWQGTVRTLNGRTLYQGREPCDLCAA